MANNRQDALEVALTLTEEALAEAVEERNAAQKLLDAAHGLRDRAQERLIEYLRFKADKP